ncbi:MAG TPA: protein kinase [Gemmatimonadaceae bacterium]|nr:protein kinase [Gemmatimonadaceae bacterium]
MSAQKLCPQCGSEYELDVMFCPRDGSTLRVPAGGGLEGSVIADRYHVLRKLGEGGMGQVYLAEHIKMGRKSAIKVMNPSMSQDPDAIGRFNREAANASRITNTNVAAIYDFGETPDGLIYLAMEYVEGESLTKVMEKTGALPADRAANITRQVAEGLDAAHEIGIVHRDLKPDNIMIAKQRDGSDLVKVVDFGIAKAAGGDAQKVTKTGLVVGTPEYMSPEQLSGDPLDARSDIYTLALVTFHMLTGTLPFPSSTLQESMIMRLTDRPRTLAEMRPDASWPAPIQAVLDRALQRKADDRYQHATDFSSDLTRAVSAMPAGATLVGRPPVAATAGGAMPSTAVRNAAGTGTRAPSMPNTTPTAAPALAASATRPQAAGSGSRRGMVLAAAGLLIVALGGGGYVYFSRAKAADKAPVVAIRDSRPAAGTNPAPRDSASKPADSTVALAPNAGADSANAPAVQEFAKPGASAPAAEPPAQKTSHAAKERRVSRTAASSTVTPPPVRPPSVQRPSPGSSAPPAGSNPPSSGSNAPAVSPPNATSSGPSAAPAADSDFTGSLSAARAKAALNRAADLIKSKEPDRALVILSRALKALPTGNDSVTAFYHVSEALLERADMTNSPEPRQRACAILGSLRNARGTTYAESITFMFNQYCK